MIPPRPSIPVSATCTTERFLIAIDVEPDYALFGSVYTHDDLESSIWDFDAGWPLYFSGASFKTSIVPRLESSIRGAFNTAGVVSGVMDWRPHGGCLYTFRAFRQHTYNVQPPARVQRMGREAARLSETVPGQVPVAASLAPQ